MTPDIINLADGWPETRFDRDDDISGLARDEFTGLLNADNAWMAMVNGRIVRNEIPIDEFDGRSGTAYESPSTLYPLLYAMLDTGGDVETQYFTEETPISEADEKLSGGEFTGYIELSEDVLSGDYYAIYYGNRAMYVGFLGDGEVITGDEAFERADDEVGLYEVVSVDLDVTDIEPEPDTETTETDSVSNSPGVDSDAKPASDGATTDSETNTNSAAGKVDTTPGRDSTSSEEPISTDSPSTNTEAESEVDGSPTSDVGGDDSSASNEPSVDDFDRPDAVGGVDVTGGAAEEAGGNDRSDDTGEDVGKAESGASGVESPPTDESELDEIRDRLSRVADHVEANETGVENLQNQIAQLAERLDAVERRNQRLGERLEKGDVGGSNGQSSTGDEPEGESVSPGDALEQTDLFARYASKGEPTLEDAVEDPELRDEVSTNLQFETHTRFDRDNTVVDGEPFDDYFADTLERRLADWLTTELLYEIESTDNVEALEGIYDVLPEIDRFDIRGHVDVGEDAEGAPFDVVVRDQRGRPLVVADTNNTHDPVGESDVSTLVEKASTVATEHETLGAAVYVTESFFESGALEVADEETGGGFFSSRKGWVKLARKSGYHLCLVEGRREAFHITLPEI